MLIYWHYNLADKIKLQKFPTKFNFVAACSELDRACFIFNISPFQAISSMNLIPLKSQAQLLDVA